MAKERKPLGRGKNLEEALKNIREKRELPIGSLGELALDVEGITTGNIAIDQILGGKGIPIGRLAEFYGPPSSGKTTCALQIAAAAQKEGRTVAFFDFENSLDPEYCVALGLDPFAPTFLISQPETFEQGMNAMRELIETGEIAVVIVDSVAAMTIEKELFIETGGSTFADKAKLMAQTMRQLTPIVSKHGVVCIFLNHIQDVIDATPMGQKLAAAGVKRTTTPGGKALKFQASVRIEFKPIGNVRGKRFNPLTNETEDMVVETKVQVTVVKNKVGTPFEHAEVRVKFGQGFSQAWTVLQILVAHKVIKKGTGGVYTFPEGFRRAPDEATIRGEAAVVRALEESPLWLEQLADYAGELLEEHGTKVLAPEEPVPVTEEESSELDELLADA